jgi:hypothetical protein
LILAKGTPNFTALSLQGKSWRPANFSAQFPFPSSDGQSIIDQGQAFTPDGKLTAPSRYHHGHAVWATPALQGGLTVSFNEAYETAQSRMWYLKLMLHLGGDPEPLLVFPRKIAAVEELVERTFGKFHPFERHVFFAPDYGVLAVLPVSYDRIELHRFNLDELLKDAKRDFMFVLSSPVTSARVGAEYRYPLVVKANKGGLAYRIASGPSGMNISAQGVVTWTPTAEAVKSPVNVSITVNDAAGGEAVQKFQIRVAAKE